MTLKINGNNISKIKVNGTNIQLAKINGEIVFQLENATITLTFTDKNIKAISDTTGSYDFYYANANGIIKEYDKIASFNLIANVTSSYTYLNSFNIAPYKAKKIGVCKSGTTKILSSSSLPSQFLFDSSTYGSKLYSVGLISDTHIDGDGIDTADSINDFEKALTLFSNENVSFIAHCGDVTEDNRDSDYTAYSNIVADNTIPIKTIAGNHDSYSTLQSITGNSLYYEYTPDGSNDIYLFLGSYQANTTNPFSDEELTWLENKLEEYKNKRVFLFFHYYCDPVGDANNLDNDDLGTTGQAAKFRNLMAIYKDNVIYFSGHSHLTYKLQEKVSTANINSATVTLPKRVHIPSTGRPRILTDGTITNENVGSECSIMDVYENCIVLRGIDLTKNKFLPIANYMIDTTIEMIEVDENLLKLLEENSSWVSYNGTEASAIFNSDNTITISANGTSSWGLNISQPNLTLSAGKTYKFSCGNIGSSTWISLNNENSMQLNSGISNVEFTLSEDIVNPQIVIWVSSSVVYDNVIWDIKLEEI